MVLYAGRYGPLWLILFPIISQYFNKHSWVYEVIEHNDKYQITIASKHAEIKGQRVEDSATMTDASRYYQSITKLK